MEFNKLNVMVVYGGVSPEHDVAIVTALQVMKALRGAGFDKKLQKVWGRRIDLRRWAKYYKL